MTLSNPEPTAPANVPARPAERPHPLTPLIRGWVVLLAILIGLGREFLPDGSEPEFRLPPIELIIGGIALITLGAAAVGYISWRFTHFITDDRELRIDTGMLFRQSQRIAYD